MRDRDVRWLGFRVGKIIECAFRWALGLPRRTWTDQFDSRAVLGLPLS
jgi:hypothetical protein